jgi:cyclic-di-AMP phosphodiesterase PgpH
VLLSLATLAVVSGAAFALVAAAVTERSTLGVAAALGALGAIAAGLVAALGMTMVRRSSVPTLHEELVDVSSPIHPLMKRLIAEAPGTYVHSVAVANLAEAGADAIGADALVARVGGYYHDIGKLTQPCFFFENQEEGDNPHAMTKPSQSAEIIMAHVNDGVAIAEQHELPREIIDIIREHHGTSLVRYFYHRASESGAAVFESDFRYRGFAPRSREAALVMLADASEASVRALEHPSSAEIEHAVRAVIAERGEDAQLAESGLSEGDLETATKAFVKRLMSVRHGRCPFPNPARPCSPEGSSDADQRPQQA